MSLRKSLILALSLAVLIILGNGLAGTEFAAQLAAANGHGTLYSGVRPNGQQFRRQFSLSVRQNSDGTASGNAILHNPFDDGAHGNQPYMLQIDVSCMKVIGNVAFFGGLTRRTTDPNLVDAVYFSIEDNGNPGHDNDQLSRGFFFDDDPTTTGDPQLCQGNQLGDFPMEPIEAGNISLR